MVDQAVMGKIYLILVQCTCVIDTDFFSLNEIYSFRPEILCREDGCGDTIVTVVISNSITPHHHLHHNDVVEVEEGGGSSPRGDGENEDEGEIEIQEEVRSLKFFLVQFRKLAGVYFPNCIFCKCIFAKCTRLKHLL